MIATTARSKPATPGMSLHEAIAKQSVSQVRVHINHGTVIDQEFIPEGTHLQEQAPCIMQ
jgi:hypothetical protein